MEDGGWRRNSPRYRLSSILIFPFLRMAKLSVEKSPRLWSYGVSPFPVAF
jgi:hypothetical protein